MNCIVKINSLSCSWHEFTSLFSPIHKYFLSKIWCYDYFNDAVKCILIPPQELEKVGWFQSRKKNNKWINMAIKKSWIGELVNWCHERDTHPYRQIGKFYRYHIIRFVHIFISEHLYCCKVKFIYSEKATQFCEISTIDLTGTI